jgi:hypothetical protein
LLASFDLLPFKMVSCICIDETATKHLACVRDLSIRSGFLVLQRMVQAGHLLAVHAAAISRAN